MGVGLNTVEPNVDLQAATRISYDRSHQKLIDKVSLCESICNRVDCAGPRLKRTPPYLPALLCLLGNREPVVDGLEPWSISCVSQRREMIQIASGLACDLMWNRGCIQEEHDCKVDSGPKTGSLVLLQLWAPRGNAYFYCCWRYLLTRGGKLLKLGACLLYEFVYLLVCCH